MMRGVNELTQVPLGMEPKVGAQRSPATEVGLGARGQGPGHSQPSALLLLALDRILHPSARPDAGDSK